jgi:CRP/FNR family transcriptional regulator
MQAQVLSNAAVKPDFAALAVCRGLGRQATSHVAAISSLQKKAAGSTLFSEGDTAENVYEVVRGMLRLCKLLPDGRRQVTGFLSAGHLFGLAPEGNHIYTAEAITDVTVCRYPRSAFDRLVEEMPGFARRLVTMTAQELRTAQEQMLLLGRKSASEKVASFLLLVAEAQGGGDDLDVPMSRADIADYLGLTIETVSRTLTRLKHDGLIALPTSARIEICDRDRLEELAAGEIDTDM